MIIPILICQVDTVSAPSMVVGLLLVFKSRESLNFLIFWVINLGVLCLGILGGYLLLRDLYHLLVLVPTWRFFGLELECLIIELNLVWIHRRRPLRRMLDQLYTLGLLSSPYPVSGQLSGMVPIFGSVLLRKGSSVNIFVNFLPCEIDEILKYYRLYFLYNCLWNLNHFLLFLNFQSILLFLMDQFCVTSGVLDDCEPLIYNFWNLLLKPSSDDPIL